MRTKLDLPKGDDSTEGPLPGHPPVRPGSCCCSSDRPVSPGYRGEGANGDCGDRGRLSSVMRLHRAHLAHPGRRLSCPAGPRQAPGDRGSQRGRCRDRGGAGINVEPILSADGARVSWKGKISNVRWETPARTCVSTHPGETPRRDSAETPLPPPAERLRSDGQRGGRGARRSGALRGDTGDTGVTRAARRPPRGRRQHPLTQRAPRGAHAQWGATSVPPRRRVSFRALAGAAVRDCRHGECGAAAGAVLPAAFWCFCR